MFRSYLLLSKSSDLKFGLAVCARYKRQLFVFLFVSVENLLKLHLYKLSTYLTFRCDDLLSHGEREFGANDILMYDECRISVDEVN